MKWGPIQIDFCIVGHNSGSHNNIGDIKTCQKLCEESSNLCLSVDYKISTKSCTFNSVDSSTVSLTTTCTGYKYSEIKKGNQRYNISVFALDIQFTLSLFPVNKYLVEQYE